MLRCAMNDSNAKAAPQRRDQRRTAGMGGAAIALIAPKVGFVRCAVVRARRSESPVSALSTEMCIPQHRSLWAEVATLHEQDIDDPQRSNGARIAEVR
ncbi:hypothetical protein C1J03_05405 [Sulfitobacter sp. SK012]|nr:hypothetical protein C1J03_05405 [Sulfitobacter sp. SK012]